MTTTEKQGAVWVVTPSQPLGGETTEEFLAAITGRVGNGLPQMVIDFSRVPLVDSLGLEAVLDARDAVRSRGGVVKLAGFNPLVSDIFVATGVAEHFEVFENAKSAVGSFSR